MNATPLLIAFIVGGVVEDRANNRLLSVFRQVLQHRDCLIYQFRHATNYTKYLPSNKE